MPLAELITFAVALFIAAASPGPGMTALVARALAAGVLGTVPMLVGLIIGDLLFLTATAFGLAALAHTFAGVFLAVKIAGAVYLAWLAWKLWTSPPAEIVVERDAAASARFEWRGVAVGLSITLGNPKTIVFYLALLPSLIDLGGLTALGFGELAVIVVLDLALVGMAYIVAAARARTLFRNARARRILDRTAGTMMAGAALAVVAR
jgi:threonine/homoserine/homoserine lactone efflux protein